MDITEQLVSCTVRIEAENSLGTGFFYRMGVKENGEFKPVVVTNKHVIAGSNKVAIKLKLEKDGSYITERFIIKLNEKNLFFHPNPDIDLAVFSIALLMNSIYESGFDIVMKFIDDTLIPDQQKMNTISAIEDVIVIGYPNGLWDDENIRPLVRKGITASDYKLDYQNKPQFIIDCAIFPGSSGSPVFLYDNGSYFEGGNMVLGQSRLMFLGINSSVYNNPITGELFEQQINTSLGIISAMPMGLGIIIKANQLKDIEAILPD